MTSSIPTVPVQKSPVAGRVVLGAVILAAAGLGYGLGVYGLPNALKSVTLSWWIFLAATLLLVISVLFFRRVDSRRLSLLQKCLVVSLLAHVLLALILSGVAVSQQIIQAVHRQTEMTPTVNLNLSREMEVRTQTRQQITDLPASDPVLLRPPEKKEEPLPAMAEGKLSVGVTPRMQASDTPIPRGALPLLPAANEGSVAAPGLDLPLVPVKPQLEIAAVRPPSPTASADPQGELAAVGAPVGERLADRVGIATGTQGEGLPLSRGPVAKTSVTGLSGGGDLNSPGLYHDVGGRATLPTPPTIVPLPKPAVPAVPEAASANNLQQRSYERRQQLLHQFGGTTETEKAVARSLAFLSHDQEPDGRWTYEKGDFAPGDHDPQAHDMAYTGLGTLCYLAANFTPDQTSEYQETVRKSLTYLMLHQGPDGDLRGSGNMYDHAIATLALAEAAAMTGDSKTANAALAGANFIVAAQNDGGGWRYDPKQSGDTSVLGWQVLALHSAERLGFKIPDSTRAGALKYLDSVSTGDEKEYAGYQDLKRTPTMSAEAMFARILMGQPLPEVHVNKVGRYLLSNGPADSSDNFYYWYYGSLALIQVHNAAWEQWNAQATARILALQRRDGRMDGSYEPDREWGSRGGRIYSTALATLTLEVYYRYLPMYVPANK